MARTQKESRRYYKHRRTGEMDGIAYNWHGFSSASYRTWVFKIYNLRNKDVQVLVLLIKSRVRLILFPARTKQHTRNAFGRIIRKGALEKKIKIIT